MENGKLKVLVLNDMVLFPKNEIRMEYDNIYDKEVLDLINTIDEEMLLVNPINDGESFNITQLPKVGVLARLKLKLNVPNGKTRVVIEGISRVEIYDYEKSDALYVENYKFPQTNLSLILSSSKLKQIARIQKIKHPL